MTRLTLLLCVALADCGGNPSLGDHPVLTGQIVRWILGPTQMQAFLSTMASPDLPLSTGPIDAMGNFSITLPGYDLLAPYLVWQQPPIDPKSTTECGKMVFQSNVRIDQFDYATASLAFGAATGTAIRQILPPSLTPIKYIYVNRDLNETGTVKCKYTEFHTGKLIEVQETIELHLGVGWNQVVTSAIDTSMAEFKYSVTTGQDLSGSHWEPG